MLKHNRQLTTNTRIIVMEN